MPNAEKILLQKQHFSILRLLTLINPDVTLRFDPPYVHHLSVTVFTVVYCLELGSGSFWRCSLKWRLCIL